MKLKFEVSIDVSAGFFRGIVPVAGVTGRSDEARAELGKIVNAQLEYVLLDSKPSKNGLWDAMRVKPILRRRIGS